MKVVIAGGRDFTSIHVLLNAIAASKFNITLVISGACLVTSHTWWYAAKGADGLGELWALHHGIPVKRFYADLFGRWPAAGPRRNLAMAKAADGVILLPGGRGTKEYADCGTRGRRGALRGDSAQRSKHRSLTSA